MHRNVHRAANASQTILLVQLKYERARYAISAERTTKERTIVCVCARRGCVNVEIRRQVRAIMCKCANANSRAPH